MTLPRRAGVHGQAGMMGLPRSVRRLAYAALALCIASSTQLTATSQAAAALPPAFEAYLSTAVHPTAAERKSIRTGAEFTKLLDGESSNEVIVFGSVWINAPMERYVAAVGDIESFERGGGFRITRKISSPPTLEDFAALKLPAEDVSDLRACRVGECSVKLSEQAINAFRTQVDWKAAGAPAAADTLMRRLALEYVTGYLAGGNARLAVYRDKSRPTVVADEFRAMVGQVPDLTTEMPMLRRYLLEYPTFALPDSTSFLYWQETRFGLKPTIRISHLVIQARPGVTLAASKMILATHYFRTALELRALMPDPARGPGCWLITTNRSRSDGLTGFIGRIVRVRARSGAQRATSAALASTKRILEQGR
ncbi:MAG: hypothetical protein ABIP65_00400 [Vicinamibacterales bacterium]